MAVTVLAARSRRLESSNSDFGMSSPLRYVSAQPQGGPPARTIPETHASFYSGRSRATYFSSIRAGAQSLRHPWARALTRHAAAARSAEAQRIAALMPKVL